MASAAAAATHDKFASITCPRQRAVARRVARILDLFSVEFAKMPAEDRLSAFVRAGSDAERWRNAIRIPALGMVQRLGRDLGLKIPDLHGDTETASEAREVREKEIAEARVRVADLQAKKATAGRLTRPESTELKRLLRQFGRARGCTRARTQIPELLAVQRTTAVSACAMFDAMILDRSDLCAVVRDHYLAMLVSAKGEVEEAETLAREEQTQAAAVASSEPTPRRRRAA